MVCFRPNKIYVNIEYYNFKGDLQTSKFFYKLWTGSKDVSLYLLAIYRLCKAFQKHSMFP